MAWLSGRAVEKTYLEYHRIIAERVFWIGQGHEYRCCLMPGQTQAFPSAMPHVHAFLSGESSFLQASLRSRPQGRIRARGLLDVVALLRSRPQGRIRTGTRTPGAMRAQRRLSEGAAPLPAVLGRSGSEGGEGHVVCHTGRRRQGEKRLPPYRAVRSRRSDERAVRPTIRDHAEASWAMARLHGNPAPRLFVRRHEPAGKARRGAARRAGFHQASWQQRHVHAFDRPGSGFR